MRLFFLAFFVLGAVAVSLSISVDPVPGAAATTDTLTAKYWRAVSLINLGRRSRFEKRDCTAWGEFARAYRILSDIGDVDQDFQKGPSARRMRACEVAMKHLAPSLPEADRRLLITNDAVSERLARAVEQDDKILEIIREIQDSLELLGEKETEPPEVQEEPVVDQATADDDNDGLTNDEEAKVGSAPGSSDTDGDGLTDFDEVKTYGTSPTDTDSDADNLSDGFEVRAFDTDPLNPDTDSDDLEDGQERVWGTDPNDPDTDGDGDTDGEEVKAGYDPLRHYPDDYPADEPPD